ncbi:DUF4199 domain-containing protein [Flavobacteriaceae bacterium]|nr:DUF4199 domain-containing protein [Flavobacteriaceae bacterium]
MEENNVTTGKFALNFGLILGGISVVFSLMLYFLDMHYQGGTMQSVVSFAIMAGTLIWGMIAFKQANEGFISLGEALKIGLGASLIAAIIGFAYYLVLANVLDPDLMEKTMDFQTQKMRMDNPELPQENIDQIVEMQQKMSSPWILAPIIIITNLFLGFIISLIGGLIVKKSRPE